MISIKNIFIIAKFESKILWRNWFFRIFGILAIGALAIFNLAAFSPISNAPWFFISNSWGIPYANMILLSIAQAAAIMFLASGSIIKNKKIDTNEVFLVRPLSNTDYVLGKAFAIFKLFFWLNIAILLIGLIYNLTNPLASFNILGYIIYPLLTSFSTIVFATGLSFLLTTILKNQPVSIIILLGFSVVELIYLQEKSGNIFDFMAFRLKLMASDLTGFSNIETILMQRAFYFLLGIALLFSTAIFLDRLANYKRNKIILSGLAITFISAAAVLFMNFINERTSNESLRENMISVNSQWANKPNISFDTNHIYIEHLGNEIKGQAKISGTNRTSSKLNQIFFTLNPGLKIESIESAGTGVQFERHQHIIVLSTNNKIEKGDEISFTVNYKGNIKEDVAHLEVDQERYETIRSTFIYAIAKRYAFLQPDYVLLTKDILWYPDTQIGYSKTASIKERKNFIDFQLDVKVTKNNLPVSQGIMTKNEEDIYTFKPNYPLPQISLAIGAYQKRSITVDSVEYSLYHYKENDYFNKYFDQLPDTLNILIKDLAAGYKQEQKIDYPFSQLQLVETPIQFNAYNKIYESHQARIQPEIVFYPESGGSIRDFDLKRQQRSVNNQARDQNQVLSDKEKQATIFNNVIKKAFTKQVNDNWFFDGRNPDEPNYAIFPNLYNYNVVISSSNWPTLNRSISNYLNKERLSNNDFSRNINGISFTEVCNQLMSDTPISEIIVQEGEFNKIQKSVSLKGEYLFSYLNQLIGEVAFKEFIYNWINNHQNSVTDYRVFQEEIVKAFGIDIDPIIQKIYSDTEQPAFQIENLQKFELLDGDRKRYQVMFDVKNTGDNDGVIKVSFSFNSESSNSISAEDEIDEDKPGNLSLIKMGETKQLGFLLDERPQQITINTLVSKNIPSIITLTGGKFDLRKNAKPFEGERITTIAPLKSQYEVIVDNEDLGFSTFSPIKDTYLREYLDSKNPSDKKYFGNWRGSYAKWLATTGSNFYGKHIRSSHFTRSGKGEKIAKWEPQFSESGFYDVYVFMKGKNQNQFDDSRGGSRKFTYQYIVNHGDGKDNIEFNLGNAERGWNYIGSYHFNETGGNIILTDQCELSTVYADAIKWVKQ